MRFENKDFPGGVVTLKNGEYHASIEYSQPEFDSPSSYSDIHTLAVGVADSEKEAWELVRGFRARQRLAWRLPKGLPRDRD